MHTQEELRRSAALKIMGKMADDLGCSNREWEEIDEGDIIRFVGTANDGRRFHIGYEKARAHA